MKILNKTLIHTTFALMCGFAITSCEKEVSNDNNSNNADQNSFEMRMTDAPGDYESLDIEIARVDVYRENGGWVNLSNNTQMVSVLDLNNGVETQIGMNTNVAAGTYTQARIVFGSNNSRKLNSNSESGLILPAGISATSSLDLALDANLGQERTVIIEIDEQVSANSGASILVDFNAAASIEENANQWILDPVITVIEDENTGAQGQVQGSQQASIRFVNNSTGAQATTSTNASGSFMVRDLEEGTYTATIDAEVDGQFTNEVIILDNVTIVEGEIKNMGTINVQ